MSLYRFSIFLSLIVAVTDGATISPFVPQQVSCPFAPLTRPANGISHDEASYVFQRKSKADEALKTWLQRTNCDFDTSISLPTLGMSTSGGGFRSMLTGAGVHQAFDARESNNTVSGLLQALTYESAISGGNWFLGSIARNNWPTVTQLRNRLWQHTVPNGILSPGGKNASDAILKQLHVEVDQKREAGFRASIMDVFGRLLGYMLLEQPDGGVSSLMSQIPSLSSFTDHASPYPILISAGVNQYGDRCPLQVIENPQFELTPYEFGSWNEGISAFADMRYLGSMPWSSNKTCVTGYDNVGVFMGASSDNLPASCANIDAYVQKNYAKLFNETHGVAAKFTNETIETLFPNPFFNRTGSHSVVNDTYLQLVDGGFAQMSTAIWPMLHRNVDVLFVGDNLADEYSDPNGSTVYNTYVRAQELGLTRMPRVPNATVLLEQGDTKRNVFFGCHTPDTMTIIYMPNSNYTFDSDVATTSAGYPVKEMDALIANGNAVGTSNGTANWGMCVGCAVMKKTKTALPSGCDDCFKQHCVS